MDEPERRQSPIVLYVECVECDPQIIEHGERVTVIDLEFTEAIARKICDELNKRIENDKILAAIRLRFSGRLVLS